ncbi:class A beta-lactamase [Sphingomicrobium sediminis]|uniref:beta-lactamase n=1 Tax=Sphingomicrobium sediminis TaxID=2950949 RepID=A0A9X2J117_9SPHN|nr:class A beta-lactamase [Sphingomicrobium sediminis]MCM8556808.1 class A beta-lactamase [Sphingomicrobium sediminis]
MKAWMIPAVVLLASCTSGEPRTIVIPQVEDPNDFGPQGELLVIEAQSGGDLAVALIDSAGEPLVTVDPDKRMAFCSSFKVALAGAAFEAAGEGVIDLDTSVTYTRDDFPGYQPVMEAKLVDGSGSATLGEAVDAAVSSSDNLATNMLIEALGGPEAVTARWRGWGDTVSRLDRYETGLNENLPEDLRDTSSAMAMANTLRRLIDGSILAEEQADELARLTHKSTTGLDRVRAGLPDGWSAGDKTGTCRPEGMPNQQVNDIGWFRGPDGELYYFAVMLARPQLSLRDARAIHASVGQVLADIVTD